MDADPTPVLKKRDYCWLGDAALSLVIRHLFATKYAEVPETRLTAETVGRNRFITKHTPYLRGDDFEAWVAQDFLRTVAPTPEWQQFMARLDDALVAKHKAVAAFRRRAVGTLSPTATEQAVPEPGIS